MITVRHALFLLLSTALLVGCAATAPSVPETTAKTQAAPKKHPLDKSEYRKLVLDNQLKVMLVSDSRFNKSAAAMVAGVGLFSDPDERPGLAHYLEHMLFLGTDKYPGVDDYGTYLSENGGYNNAYTDADHTNYYFEVNHDAFAGAIDRLSQFFIAPLFTQDFAEREVNAVNSEFQANLEQDSWRTWCVQNSLARAGHPASRFTIGSSESLANIDRQELLDFHSRYYSANQMQLCLLGTAPLDSMEAWTRLYFGPVENKNRPTLHFPGDYLPPKPTFRLTQVEPIKELRTLELEFPLPGFLDHYESKPLRLIGSLIGHEGQGSLLSLLKKEDLATGLASGRSGPMSGLSPDYGKFSISVDLTPKGLEEYRRVARLCLSYIAMLKQSAYPAFHFQEEKAVAALNEIYADRGEGGGYASTLARRLSTYPMEVAERVQFIYAREDSAAYRKFLSYLRPDNMMATLVAKGLEADTLTEPHWGIPYSYVEDDAFYVELLDADVPEALHLPAPNPFVPTQATIPDREVTEGVVPEKILDETGVVLYHSQDYEFLRPKLWARFKLRFPEEKMTVRFKVLLDLYTTCVKESLNEFAYPAALAGLGYSFASGYEGVYFSVSGYDESAPRLFGSVLEQMQDVRISEDTFAALKDNMIRGLRSFPRQDAYMIVRAYYYAVLNARNYTPEAKLEVAETLTLTDVREFARTLYDRAFVEALVHGNISADRALEMTAQLQRTLGVEPISWEETFAQTYLTQPDGESLTRVDHLEVNNSCFRREYRLGPADPLHRAAILVLDNFVSQPFFTEMRTTQQLGYIVFGGTTIRRHNAYLLFLIQSGDYPADVLEDRADTFIADYPQLLRSLPPETFAAYKAAAAEKLKEKQKSISQKGSKFNVEAFDYDANFDRDEKALEALEALTQEKLVALLERALVEESRQSISLLGYSRDHQSEREVSASWEALDAWKEHRLYK